MSLYHLMLHFWVRIFGESETAVRSMSALFGALAVSIVYLLGARLFGRKVGLAAAFLLALNAFMVESAQTARSYALLVLLVTLSSYFLVVELERPSTRGRIGYVLTSSAAIYAHYFAAYVLLVHAGTVLAMRRRDAFSRQWLAVAAAILVLCGPEIVIAYKAGAGELSWLTAPSLNDMKLVLVDLAGGSLLSLLLLTASGFSATVFAIRRRRWWPIGFIAAWLLVPIALCFAVSYLVPMFFPSHLVICIPALMLFGTAAIAGPRSSLLTVVLIGPLVWLSAIQLATFYRSNSDEDWRAASQYVLAATHAGDAITFCPFFAQEPFKYYQRFGETSDPANFGGRVPVDRPRVWFMAGECDSTAPPWVIEACRSLLKKQYQFLNRREFQCVGVELYTLRDKK
jgi:mannosyltransferase